MNLFCEICNGYVHRSHDVMQHIIKLEERVAKLEKYTQSIQAVAQNILDKGETDEN